MPTDISPVTYGSFYHVHDRENGPIPSYRSAALRVRFAVPQMPANAELPFTCTVLRTARRKCHSGDASLVKGNVE